MIDCKKCKHSVLYGVCECGKDVYICKKWDNMFNDQHDPCEYCFEEDG